MLLLFSCEFCLKFSDTGRLRVLNQPTFVELQITLYTTGWLVTDIISEGQYLSTLEHEQILLSGVLACLWSGYVQAWMIVEKWEC